MGPRGYCLVALFLFSACNQQKPPQSVPSDIELASSRYWSAVEHGKADSLAAMVTDDFVLMVPDSDDVRGRSAFRQMAERMFSTTRVSDVRIVSREIDQGDSAAYEIATYTETVKSQGKLPQLIRGRYLMVWKRQSGGPWLVHRSLFNMSSPVR